MFFNLAGDVQLKRIRFADSVALRVLANRVIAKTVFFAVRQQRCSLSAKCKRLAFRLADAVALKHADSSLMRHASYCPDDLPLSAGLLNQFGQHLRNRLTRPR